jgi:trimeric autotransporter adhesin
MKKKAIKIASATAIAASAFVATAPGQIEAASNIDTVVSQAVTQMKKAYHTYSDITAQGKFANISDVYAQYNLAKKQYKAARDLTIRTGGDRKDARLALLDTTYNEYIAKRVITYIDAYNYATTLAAKTKNLEAAVKAVDLDKSEAGYHDVSRELNSRTVILDRVYGRTTRELLRSTFKADAEVLVKSIRHEITVKMAVDDAEEALDNNNMPAANTAIDKADKYAGDLDNTPFGKAIAAELKKVKERYESLLDPMVTSVAALNSRQVQVNFNTELNSDKTLAGDASEVGLYSVGGETPTSAVLSESKKSVILTFAENIEGKDQVVIVDPILTNKKDADGNLVRTQKHTEILSYTDTTKPTVVDTEYSNGKIIVSFSEALGTLPTVVRVNGNPVGASALALDSDDPSKLEITYAGLQPNTRAELYLAGAKDRATTPNEMAIYSGTFTTPAADTSKPTITNVQVTDQNSAKITLSEAINESTVNATLQRGAVQSAVQLIKDTEDRTGKTYWLHVDLNGDTAGDGIFAGSSNSETFTLFVAAGSMSDSATPANKNDLYSTTLTFTRDTAPPSFAGSRVSADKQKLEFTFDDGLTVAGSDSSIVIRNAEGVNFTAVDAETDLKAGDNKTYQVDFKAGNLPLDAGTYTVTIPAGFFTDEYGNATTAITSTFTVTPTEQVDNTKPTATVETPANMKNVFDVKFSEEVTTSALNLSNYKLDGQALPSGTDISFTNTAKDTVRIVLPANSINIGNQTTGAAAILNLSGIADKAGNLMDAVNRTVTVYDNTAATITNVQTVGQDVYVTFTENLSIPEATDALQAFRVTINGTDLNADDVGNLTAVAGNAKQVRFTLTTAPSVAPTVTVRDGQTVLKDLNGVNVR